MSGFDPVNIRSIPDSQRFALIPQTHDLYFDGPRGADEEAFAHMIPDLLRKLLVEGETILNAPHLETVPGTRQWLQEYLSAPLEAEDDALQSLLLIGILAACYTDCDPGHHYVPISFFSRSGGDPLPIGVMRYSRDPAYLNPQLIVAARSLSGPVLYEVERQCRQYGINPEETFIAPDGNLTADARTYLASWRAGQG